MIVFRVASISLCVLRSSQVCGSSAISGGGGEGGGLPRRLQSSKVRQDMADS